MYFYPFLAIFLDSAVKPQNDEYTRIFYVDNQFQLISMKLFFETLLISMYFNVFLSISSYFSGFPDQAEE